MVKPVKPLSPQILKDCFRAASVNPSALQIDNFLYQYKPQPKILVLFCGGTLIMREQDDGSLVVNDKDAAMDLLLHLEPRIHEIAHLTIHYIDNIDSANMTPDTWDLIGKSIADNYDEYDGFVITHGTDTMAYTSSALSFVLGNLGKPVVFTGAQIPGGRMETDARRNFVNAVKVATMNKAGVMLVFDGDIILGARAHKLSESKLDAFGPINWGLHGEIRIDIRFSDDATNRHDQPLNFRPGFESNIVCFTLFPGFAPQNIENSISNGVKGVVLECYGSGNLSYKYLDVVSHAQAQKIPVVVTTQCLEGATLMHLYDVGKRALHYGVIQAFDMSTETITCKLMWALKQVSLLNKNKEGGVSVSSTCSSTRTADINDNDSYEQVREYMHHNFVGEINKEGKLYGNPR